MEATTGRGTERRAIQDFLIATTAAPAVLVVDGEPGMGKTTLLRDATHLAGRQGCRVLECRPTSTESLLSFAGLTDLLSGVEDATFETLPTPQRAAVSAAVLRAAAPSTGSDERAVGTGLATLLAGCTAPGPVLVAVDDAQWLDQPTRAALTFALRRVRSIPLGVLVCCRAGTAGGDLAAAVPDPSWSQRLTLRGLGGRDLFQIVRDRLGVSLSRPQLTRIVDLSEGNPYVAVELARALLAGGDSTGSDLRVPGNLQSLAAERLVSLSPEAREAVLAVACSAQPTVSLMAALGLREKLEEAESHGVVEVVGGRLTFTHPLLAAATLDLASSPQRRSMHGRLSAVVREPESVARHQALAVPEPDDAVAAALDTAVDSAVGRGAASAALDLARLALDRTVDSLGAAAWERRVRLAERLHVSGSTVEAGRTLDGIADDCPPGSLRARGWLLLTEVAYQTTSTDQAIGCARAALADAGGDPLLCARAWLSLAALSSDAADSTRHVAAARSCLDDSEVHDAVLSAWVACEEVSAQFHRGEGLDRGALDGALALERSGRVWSSGDQVAAIRPVLLKWADHHADALAGLEELRDKATEEGNDGLLPYVGGHIPVILLRMGRVKEAAAATARHLADAEAAGQDSQRVQALYNTALVDAHLGLLDTAWKTASQVDAWADRENDSWMQMSAAGVFGFVALCRNDVRTARTWFDRWATLCETLGLVDPGVSRHHGDHVEALLATGETTEAAARTAELRERARRAERVSAAAIAARCQALLASTAGKQDLAVRHLEEALRLHRQCPVPFEEARSLFAAGVVHRRAKRKREARTFLVQAANAFAGLDATGWNAAAQSELQRVAVRQGPSPELTATERRVAELAASGLTNREVAKRAFISPKTVEANLARAYRKLGISSRAQLGATMAPLGTVVRTPPR